MQIFIVDEDGELFQNTGAFPFVCAITGTVFNPGTQVKIKENDWIKGQVVLVKQVAEEAPKKEEKAPAK
jgi:hypothetical protein